MKKLYITLLVGLLVMPVMAIGKEKANEKEPNRRPNLIFIAKFHDLNKTYTPSPLIILDDPNRNPSAKARNLSPTEIPFHRFVVCETIASPYNLEGYIGLFGIKSQEPLERGKPYLVVTHIRDDLKWNKATQVRGIKLGVNLFPLPEFFNHLPYTGDCNGYFTE